MDVRQFVRVGSTVLCLNHVTCVHEGRDGEGGYVKVYFADDDGMTFRGEKADALWWLFRDARDLVAAFQQDKRWKGIAACKHDFLTVKGPDGDTRQCDKCGVEESELYD